MIFRHVQTCLYVFLAQCNYKTAQGEKKTHLCFLSQNIKGHVQASRRIDVNLEQKVVRSCLEELKTFPKRFVFFYVQSNWFLKKSHDRCYIFIGWYDSYYWIKKGHHSVILCQLNQKSLTEMYIKKSQNTWGLNNYRKMAPSIAILVKLRNCTFCDLEKCIFLILNFHHWHINLHLVI